MTLHVNPDALIHFRDNQTSLSTKIDPALKYAHTNLENLGLFDTGVGGALAWQEAVSKVPDVREAILANLERLHELTAQSARVMGEAGEDYKKIDLHHAQQIDDGFTEPSFDSYQPAGKKGDITDPASLVVDPVAKHKIPPIIGETFSISSWLNLGKVVNEAIDFVCGVNPAEWVTQRLTGDWEEFSKAADSLRHLGNFYASFGDQIGSDLDLLLQSWQGHAATGAAAYFSSLAEKTQNQRLPLLEVSQQFDITAEGVSSTTSAVQGLVEDLMDTLIIAGIKMAATAALSETVIGGIAGAALTAVSIYRAKRTWQEILKRVNDFYTYATAFSGVIFGYSAPLKDLSIHPLPAGAYQAPQVAGPR